MTWLVPQKGTKTLWAREPCCTGPVLRSVRQHGPHDVPLQELAAALRRVGSSTPVTSDLPQRVHAVSRVFTVSSVAQVKTVAAPNAAPGEAGRPGVESRESVESIWLSSCAGVPCDGCRPPRRCRLYFCQHSPHRGCPPRALRSRFRAFSCHQMFRSAYCTGGTRL